ncbi:hypothetical protein BDW62DRAFT_215323 [Aspergillus aurantiobrunneus]
MADLIWQGQIPPHVAAPTNPPPDLNNLDQYSPFQVMAYMEDFPHLAERIYRWGLSDSGPWTGLPQFHNEDALVQWHNNLAPSESIPGRLFPLDQLAELWEPLGYAADGVSYLLLAFDSSAELVFNYIAYHARNHLAFCNTNPTAPRLHRGVETFNGSHIDWALHIGEYTLFKAWWKCLDTPVATLNRPGREVRLSNESRIILCRTVTRAMADRLRTHNSVNLADVDTTNINGSIWHLALANPNSNFIEAIAPFQLDRIDLLAGHRQSPLELAQTNNRFSHFKKLLSVGANADLFVNLNNFPESRDKWFRTVLTYYRNINPNPGAQVQGGTLIHDVIRGLHLEITSLQSNRRLTPVQKARQRRALANKAIRLIRLVRLGSRYGRPDLTTQNENGETGLDVAQSHGYNDVFEALEENPLPHFPIPVVPMHF